VKIVELCLGPGKGGLELYMLRVVRWLSASQLECVAVVAPGGALAPLLEAEGLPYRLLKVSFRWFPLVAACRLARWIDREGIDVIHVHWGKDLNLAVLARSLARRSARIVVSRQMALTQSKRDWYHRALYRHVDLMLVITRRLEREALRYLPLPSDRIRLLYHGVAAPPLADPGSCTKLREQAGIPPGRFTIGLFGRIEAAKGHHVLVEAVSLLVGRDRNVHAVLFGDPMNAPYLDALRVQVARLGLERRVHFYGFHPRSGEVMGCLDCVVLTTYDETFGLVLPEAMRAGVAVIGTDAGGVPEIIDHERTGLLVPPRDPAALADAIERLVRDPGLRTQLAASGKASADARFNEERHFDRLLALLEGSS
jgi:glycosyltransferase involved in cell wall biosynthesis